MDHAVVNFLHGGQVIVELLCLKAAVSREPRRWRSGGILRASRSEILTVRRQRVAGLEVFVQLEAMLHVAQKLVSRGQASVIGIGEQPFIAQTEEREHSAAVAHPGLAIAAMQALQALHQKLDVADATGSQLDVDALTPALLGSSLFADALTRVSRHCFDGAKVE